MRVKEVTLEYGEKRSAGYQSVSVGLTVKVELGEGETIKDAVQKYREDIRKSVTAYSMQEANRLLEESRDAR